MVKVKTNTRFGNTKLSFKRNKSKQETMVFCEDDKEHFLKIKFYPLTKSWIGEIHNNKTTKIKSYGGQLLDGGNNFKTEEEAFDFVYEKLWM